MTLIIMLLKLLNPPFGILAKNAMNKIDQGNGLANLLVIVDMTISQVLTSVTASQT